VSQLLTSLQPGLDASKLFQEQVIDGATNIRDAVNSGARSFADVIKLVEKATQFKNWLREHEQDEKIAQTYLRDVTHIDWADKLPSKTLRWLLISTVGAALSWVPIAESELK
jgi:hypothetical protein